jgi:hypothetical protein
MRRRMTSKKYFQAIDDLAGGGGTYYRITDPEESPAVEVVVYSDVPEVGHTTSFTFGLSSATHAEWVKSRPELVVSVRSLDHAWGLCIGEIVRNSRDKSLFEQGTILHFREQISDESGMTSFLVYACGVLDQQQQRMVLPDRVVNISQCYPIYEEEAALIHRVGLEKFFGKLGIDFYDVRRKPAA